MQEIATFKSSLLYSMSFFMCIFDTHLFMTKSQKYDCTGFYLLHILLLPLSLLQAEKTVHVKSLRLMEKQKECLCGWTIES